MRRNNMNLSERDKVFPERPWFKEWRESEKFSVRAVMQGCVTERNGKLVCKHGSERKLEALYEFLAAKGCLAEFEATWKEIEACIE